MEACPNIPSNLAPMRALHCLVSGPWSAISSVHSLFLSSICSSIVQAQRDTKAPTSAHLTSKVSATLSNQPRLWPPYQPHMEPHPQLSLPTRDYQFPTLIRSFMTHICLILIPAYSRFLKLQN